VTAVGTDVEDRARELLNRLTTTEKLRMLTGDQDLYRDMMDFGGDHERRVQTAAAVPRLGLGGLHFVDGPRGVAVGKSTCFPAAIARAAAFDYDLEERVGEAIGREARAQGANWCGAPCLNLLRHPGWGRAQETYGESSDHIGEMGAAFVRGLQRHVMGCAKHFACNSIENSRFQVDVKIAENVLDRVYLPHFKRVVDEGVASIMSAYNSVNGEWCGQNHRLLTTILKERWGFDGFVVSDWVFGIRDGVKAVNAGLDLEMPSRIFIDDRVAKALKRGAVTMSRVDDAALRLIRQQLRFDVVGDGDYSPEVVACAAHRALAREAAAKGIVLLRNERVHGRPALPLRAPGGAVPGDRRGPGGPESPGDPAGAAPAIRRLAVIGRLADAPNTGDRGSSNVTSTYVVTPLQGLRAALAPLGVEVLHDDGTDHHHAAALATSADAALIVAGYDYRDEGEYLGEFPPPGFKGLLPRPPLRLLPKALLALARMRAAGGGLFGGGGDRMSLALHEDEEELILQVAAANQRTVVVLVCGSAVLMERWRHSVPGILVVWYAGMEGGHALADVVLGRQNPSGRLPVAIPTSPEYLPPFDPWATTAEYDELHGQALLDHLGVPAAYPYGFGLNYTE
jgi:beta-glucosidase